jgi:hypothetical protein
MLGVNLQAEMHDIEPFYGWRDHYVASEDVRSPFFEREYSETHFTDQIYDHFIHPQWDNLGSTTLFAKVLYADYEESYAILELMGEWNDTLFNDIMTLKRQLIEPLMSEGVSRFILLGENVLNFHNSDDCYYEEWFDEVTDEDGWIALVNFRTHVIEEFADIDLDSYFVLGGELQELAWRTFSPEHLFSRIDENVARRLTSQT